MLCVSESVRCYWYDVCDCGRLGGGEREKAVKEDTILSVMVVRGRCMFARHLVWLAVFSEAINWSAEV